MSTQPQSMGVPTEGAPIGRFSVAGRPVTKGHMKPLPHRSRSTGKLAITLHDREETYAWLQTLIKGIREQVGIVPIIKGKKVVGVNPPWPCDIPVRVDFTAYFVRTIGVDGTVWDSHNTPYPTALTCGDGDTLERCLWDALTQSGMITDDRMVVEWSGRKRWVSEFVTSGPGIECEVWPA